MPTRNNYLPKLGLVGGAAPNAGVAVAPKAGVAVAPKAGACCPNTPADGWVCPNNDVLG